MPTKNSKAFNNSSLKDRISTLRKENNITMGKMAEEVNMSRNAYASLENGTTTILNPILDDIAKAFDMNVDDIIFYDPSTSTAPTKARASHNLEVARLKTNVVMLCSIMERVASSKLSEEDMDFLLQTLKKISAEPGGPALKYLKKLDSKF